MKLFRFFRVRQEHSAAIAVNEEILAAADCHHKDALAKLAQVEEQAQRLSRMDKRNHYSESLTEAFRGRTA